MSEDEYLQMFLRKHAKAKKLAVRFRRRIKTLASLHMKRLKVDGTLRKQLKQEAYHHMEKIEEAEEFLNHLRRVGVSNDTKEKSKQGEAE